ncbi:hypothetical protein ACSST1_22285 [Pantoea agglomerans]|nr:MULTISPECIES: hypothetical protein [Pantoea]
MALRNLAAAYGTEMPRYLLALEVAVLLSKVPDLKKRLLSILCGTPADG